MSYCRFSSDNFKCDVYVYEAAEGICIHVAASRYIGDIPEIPPYNSVPFDEWLKANIEQQNIVAGLKTKNIGGNYDGADFYGLDHKQAIERLEDISKNGYNVPDYVFSSLKEEMHDYE